MHLYFAERFVKSLPETLGATFQFVAPVSSTNELMTPDMGEFSVVVSDEQIQGRGRLGRSWTSQKGRSLAISVLLKPLSAGCDMATLSWLPLMGGLAMCEALNAFSERYFLSSEKTFQLKWPNDVLEIASGKKIAGVLSQLAPNSDVIIGTGVNIAHSADELPVETATSLKSVCDQKLSYNPAVKTFTEAHFDGVLTSYLENLYHHYSSFVEHRGDAQASVLAAKVVENCLTIQQKVRVVVDGQPDFFGTAVGIGTSGELLVEEDFGKIRHIFAGDITHLRHHQ